MTSFDSLERVLALVRVENALIDDAQDVAGQLQRLCRAAAREMSVSGVGLSVMSPTLAPVTVAASSSGNQEIEELQFTLGEGPCLDAYSTGGPVLVADLAEAGERRWPAYSAAALALGVRAVFVFPLQVGVARLGALDVYRDRPGPLSPSRISTAFDFAELALHWLLDANHLTDDQAPLIDGALDNRFELYQAQGMVMIQLGVDMPTAMVRMRAHAYAYGLRLSQVAADVVSRKLTMEVDDG